MNKKTPIIGSLVIAAATATTVLLTPKEDVGNMYPIGFDKQTAKAVVLTPENTGTKAVYNLEFQFDKEYTNFNDPKNFMYWFFQLDVDSNTRQLLAITGERTLSVTNDRNFKYFAGMASNKLTWVVYK